MTGAATPVLDAASTPLTTSGQSGVLVSAARNAYLVRSDGAIYGWGDPSLSTLGASPSTYLIEELAGSTTLVAGEVFACGLRGTDVLCIGTNDHGVLGGTTSLDAATATPLTPDALACARARQRTAADLYCWGENHEGQAGQPVSSGIVATPSIVAGLPGAFDEVGVGDDHTCALMRDGRVLCWGANDIGQLGIGSWDLVPRSTPVEVCLDLPGE